MFISIVVTMLSCIIINCLFKRIRIPSLIGISNINQDYASLVLTISVIAIIMFAPMGAILMDLRANKLLQSTN